MNMRRWLGLCAGFGLGIGTAHATVWYVATNGSDTASGTNWAEAYATISNALASNATVAGENHEVWVSNGTYNLSAQLVLTKGVRLWGASGANQTILDGGGTNRCVFITNGVLDGFTVTNGYADSAAGNQYGGGVYIVTGQVLNCTVTGNRGYYAGGGIFGPSVGVGLISNCVIAGNTSTNSGGAYTGGGGAYFTGSGWQVLDCPSINDNQAYLYGGGLRISGASLVSNCVVSNNISYASGPVGGGVYAYDRAQVVACLVASNVATTTNGAGRGGGIWVGNTGLVVNCTVRNNETGENGGGIYADNGSMVKNCPEIAGNWTATGTKRGGGIFLSAGSIVSDSTICFNTAARGGGVSSTSSGTISNCVISGNSGRDEGGGVSGNGAQYFIRNCLITENLSSRGAGVLLWDGHTTGTNNIYIENCTIVSNRASTGDGAGIYCWHTNTVINTIIYSNRNNTGASDFYQRLDQAGETTFTNCCTPGAASLTGAKNIPDYPEFVDPTGGDWRLTADSPCVNAGTNLAWVEGALDLDGRRRADAFSRQVDIGVYEYVPQGALIQLK